MILKLELDIELNASDRQEMLINPVNEALGSTGNVIFNLPEYSIDENGNRKLENTSIDIKLEYFDDLKKIKQVLEKIGYLQLATVRFKGDYNLIELV